MYRGRFFTDHRYLSWRAALLAIAGLLLSLILIRMAFTQKTGEYSGPPVRLAVISKNEVLSRLSDVVDAENFDGVSTDGMWQGVNCTFPDQYWRDHPEAWPVDNVLVGRFTYDRAQLNEILSTEGEDLKTRLLKQFLASVFNVMKGADAQAVKARLEEAAVWIDANLLNNALTETESQTAEALLRDLEDFNFGRTGPGLCPGYTILASPTPVPTPTPTPRVITAYNPGVQATIASELANEREANRRRQARQPAQEEISTAPPVAPTPQPVIEVLPPPAAPEPTQPPPDPGPAPGQGDQDGGDDAGNEGGNEGGGGNEGNEDGNEGGNRGRGGDEDEDEDEGDVEEDPDKDDDKDKDDDRDEERRGRGDDDDDGGGGDGNDDDDDDDDDDD